MGYLCGPTFELSGRQLWNTRPGLAEMRRVWQDPA